MFRIRVQETTLVYTESKLFSTPTVYGIEMGVVLNDYHYGGLPGRPSGPVATLPNRADRCEYE